MLASKLISQKDKLIQDNGLLKLAVVIFGIATIVSTVVSYQSRNYIRTIITPSHLDAAYEVTANWMDDQGLKSFARDSLDLLLNFTTESVEDRFHDLMKMVLLKNYSKVQQQLEDELRTIQRLNIISSFLPESYSIDRKKNIISVVGLRRKESGGRSIFDGPERWNIYFEIVEANFKISTITKSTNIRKVDADVKE